MSKEETQKRAEEMVEKGKKLLKFSLLNLLKGDRYDQAKDCFEKAANLYKMIKMYEQAAECYKEQVAPLKKQDSAYEAASALQSASQMYEKVEGNEEEAIACLREATTLYLDIGKFGRAAKTEEKLGSLLEEEEKFNEAIKAYENAGTYFDNATLKTSELECQKKVGHLHALLENYDKSIEKFEEVGKYMCKDKSLKWNAKEFFFKAIVVMLVRAGGDMDEEIDNIKVNFETFKDLDSHFDDSDYADLIEDIIKAMQDENYKSFQKSLKKYENKGRELDSWTTKMCLKVLECMKESLEDAK